MTQTCRRARVIATFRRRASPRKPTTPPSLLLTSERITASRSPPWKPSTDRTDTPRTRSSAPFSPRSSSTCPLYGVMMQISDASTPRRTSARACAMATAASPSFAWVPSPTLASRISQPAVSSSRRTASVISSSTAASPSPSAAPAAAAAPSDAAARRRSRRRASTSSETQCDATLSWARSSPAYIAAEAQLEMDSFMRYCSLSITPMVPPCCAMRRSKSVTESPLFAAASLLIVGGSCLWSPARMRRRPHRIAFQQSASSAIAASSITTVSKPSWRRRSPDAAPVHVQSTTAVLDTMSPTTRFSRCRTSFRSARTSPRSANRSSRSHPLRRICRTARDISLRASLTSCVPSASSTFLSRETRRAVSLSRAGCPSRTIRPERLRSPSRSTMLSTATLLGAQTRTFSPRLTSSVMISTTTVVLPVPGGPWMSARRGAHRAFVTASRCRGFSRPARSPSRATPALDATRSRHSGGTSPRRISRTGVAMPPGS